MTAAELILLMATWNCHTMTVNVAERRETVVQTICVKIEVTPLKEETKPVAAEAPKAPVVKKATKKKVTRCKRKYYWKKKHKYWRCVR